MPIWEYKIIGSGKGGFATPALLESFLNQLGKEEWEIIRFQSPPDNPLAFSGLARRPTQRDWTLEDAAAAAARAEADKLRAEFEAKFKEASGSAPEEKPETVAAERAAGDDGFRKPRDTESDLDPEADENGEGDDWDKLGSEDELPTFFEAIRPLMRRNQRGPGLSAGVDHLAKRWQMTEEEVVGALKECGLEVPEDEDAPPVYVEYDGDLFWVNVNRRGELWINTKEKPRPVFRVVPGTRVVPDPSAEPAAEPEASDRGGRRRRDSAPESAPADAPPAEPQPIPSGPALLEALVPQMRRDRRGDGLSGSVSFLARALRTRQEDLIAGFAALGLTIEEGQQESPAKIEAGGKTWFLNRDQRGGVWINGRRIPEPGAPEAASAEPALAGGDAPPAATEGEPASQASDGPSPLTAVRLLLAETKPGSFGAEIGRLAETLGKGRDELVSTLLGLGLKIPEKPRDKPVFVEHAGEIFWFNRTAEDQLWLNAKASKYPGGRRPRSRSRKPEGNE
jgi:hypothetical protein